MNLYKISQSVNTEYNAYDSAVVVAPTIGDAALIPPAEYISRARGTEHEWVSPENVKVEYIGIAAEHLKEGDVIVASFNAG